ncbi:MAG: cytochrome c [Candidatus Acidiferrales bacterium]
MKRSSQGLGCGAGWFVRYEAADEERAGGTPALPWMHMVPLHLWARAARAVGLAALALVLVGCRMDMHEQPKYLPYEPTTFFDDGRSERPVVPGTVARGQLRLDELLYTGKENGALSDRFPFPITRQDLERGRERYNIYCTPCHDYTGSGRGVVVQRGFQQPPSYHIDRLRQAPVGHFFDVMTNGFGAMYSYASRIEPEDRWRIAAYIRVLQRSQHATLDDVPEAKRQQLTGQNAGQAK